jgi:hypothetical protein
MLQAGNSGGYASPVVMVPATCRQPALYFTRNGQASFVFWFDLIGICTHVCCARYVAHICNDAGQHQLDEQLQGPMHTCHTAAWLVKAPFVMRALLPCHSYSVQQTARSSVSGSLQASSVAWEAGRSAMADDQT